MTLDIGHFFCQKKYVFRFSTKNGPKSISNLILATGTLKVQTNPIPEKFPNTYNFWHFLAWVGIILMKIDRPF